MLASCATKPVSHPFQSNEAVQAKSLMQSGQHRQASDLYQTLAQSTPVHSDQFNLLAAEASIQSGDSYAAQTLADKINPPNLSAKQRNRLNLLFAQITLSNGETEQALNYLSIIQPYQLNHSEQIVYYQSLAFSHTLTSNPIQSVKARIKLSPLLDDEQLRYNNNKVILSTLNLLPTETLILNQPAAPDILGGWMALTKILKTSSPRQNPTEFQSYLAEWEQAFPKHPANADFLQTYLESSKHHFKLPTNIAIILPETGRFAIPAEIIREGFRIAYSHSEPDFQPSLRFYDSSYDNPVNLYQQAISEGAELIIGPLSKDNIQTLASEAELTVPVLALNHIPNLARKNLFQFGLSPIDEAKQLTTIAYQNGHKKVLILTPETSQGQRIAEHLTEHWLETEGIVLESQSYQSKGNDFSKPIKDLLNLDESKNRYARLKRFLARDIHYTDRRRQDIDAIFLVANPQTARSIYPQLRFYRATRVPVYAIQVYNGQPNPSLDKDLDKITFCDIPWLFPDEYQGELSQESLSSIWQQYPARYLRLLALGIDSFTIIEHLDQLDMTSYAGATGTLSLNLENRITRQLICAKFIKGKPVIQDF
jgi:outer membrane PBP1 activator LpoA protein